MSATLRRSLVVTTKLFDVAAFAACYVAAAIAIARPANATTVEHFLAMRIRVRSLVVFAFLAVLWHVIFDLFGVYGSKRLTSRWREVHDLVCATAVASALVYLASSLLGISAVHGWFLPAFFVAAVTVTVASRAGLRWMLGWVRRRGRNLRFALIVGTNARAVAFARKLQARPELGYVIVGFVDSRAWDAGGEFDRSGYRLLGDVSVIPLLLRTLVVDEIMVFLPFKSFYEQEARIVSQCEEQGVRVTFPSSAFALKNAHAAADELEDGPVLTIATGGIAGAPALVKRCIDILVSAAALVVLAPALLAIACAVKLSSPGPVLFAQERVGLNKRRFRMWKFRTMVADAERRLHELERLNEADGPVFKIRRDPRVTRVGALLRRTSLDELPQLWNVLKGDLSLVGPRPLPVRDYERFDRDCHRRRFSVRPGITCLWQIGGRSDVPFERWMQLDLEYIDTWSLWLDLKILFKTIPAVVRGTGAA